MCLVWPARARGDEMPKRSKIFDLPPELRDELNERLVTNGFQDYDALVDWLSERGFNMSRSAVHRYGQNLQQEFEEAMGDVKKTTQMAKALSESDADTQGHLVDATARIVQEQLLRITIALRKAEHEPEKAAKYIASVTHALADIGRMSLGQKKWAEQIRSEERKRAMEDAAQAAEKSLHNQGLSADVVANIKREILGIA